MLIMDDGSWTGSLDGKMCGVTGVVCGGRIALD